jgi:ParB-like chromosome segregation protein Spo0J
MEMPIGVVMRLTAELVPYANNARTHTAEQVMQIAASMREFGFTNPVLISAQNDIIAGHARVVAAELLGLEEVPCIELGYLTGPQRRAYILADNQIALNAGWNNEMLTIELGRLDDIDGFDLSLTGFSGDELATLGLGNEPKDEDEKGPAAPKQYACTIACDDEADQRETIEELVSLGYSPQAAEMKITVRKRGERR